MILVTGGTGFIGRRVVADLVAAGHAVRVFARAAPSDLPDGVSVIAGDLADRDSIARALDHAEAVVHLAASFGGEGVFQINVEGTRILAETAKHAGLRRFVHVSSAGVYGEPDRIEPNREDGVPSPVTPYQRSKLMAEKVLEKTFDASETEWIILRPTDVFGPTSEATVSLFRRVARNRIWLHAPCHSLLQPVYVRDLVALISRAVEYGGPSRQIVNIGGPAALDYADWIAHLGASLQMKPWQVRLPPVSGAMSRTATRLLRRAGLPVPYRLARFGRTFANRSVDISRSRLLLAYDPTPVAVALQETADAIARTGLRR